VAEQVTSMYAAAAAEKHVQLHTELAEDARTLQGDARLMHLILKNLLDNAVKFTSAGTVTIRSYRRVEEVAAERLTKAQPEDVEAVAEASADEDVLIVEVQDTGCGISVEDQERVFERFYTVNRSRGGADRGTGLGLAIVKHAVAAMGGHVSLASQPGQGTTMKCHFPKTHAAEPVNALVDDAQVPAGA
jgi:signal transduction histidine kinase